MAVNLNCIDVYAVLERANDKKLYVIATKHEANTYSEHLSQLQTSKFSMTSFYVTTFICSSVRATLTIFSMASALAQKLAC